MMNDNGLTGMFAGGLFDWIVEAAGGVIAFPGADPRHPAAEDPSVATRTRLPPQRR